MMELESHRDSPGHKSSLSNIHLTQVSVKERKNPEDDSEDMFDENDDQEADDQIEEDHMDLSSASSAD